jgi:hypothetical protein
MLYFEKPKTPSFLASLLFFLAAIVACFFLQYYAVFLFLGCGILLYLRSKGNRVYLLALVVLICLIFSIEFHFLYKSNLYPNTKRILRVLAGIPSPYINLDFFQQLPLGVLLYIIPFSHAIIMLAKRIKIPDHFLFFFLSVALPLLGFGFFRWAIPPRFLIPILPFFILCCITGVLYIASNLTDHVNIVPSPYRLLIYTCIISAFVNPLELKERVNPTYGLFPDHKGAASFLKALQLTPHDIVLAEDILQQTFYYGAVDYWLIASEIALRYSTTVNNVICDIYTYTPVITNGNQLRKLIKNANGKAVYIITNGEIYPNKTAQFGDGILETIKQMNPSIIFTGRDKKTQIWLFQPPSH